MKTPLLVDLLGQVPAELDLQLELDEDLTVFLPAGALRLCGLRPGELLAVDLHPLSLRLDPYLQTPDLPLAHLDLDGRLRLPMSPPLLSGRRVVLQVRDRGLHRELHLVALGSPK